MDISGQTCKNISKTERAMEKCMLGIGFIVRIKNLEMRRKSKVKNITTRTDNLKWSWTVHKLRSKINKWSK